MFIGHDIRQIYHKSNVEGLSPVYVTSSKTWEVGKILESQCVIDGIRATAVNFAELKCSGRS